MEATTTSFFLLPNICGGTLSWPGKFEGGGALTTKLIRFDYLVTIYIQELCTHPLWGVSEKGRDCE